MAITLRMRTTISPRQWAVAAMDSCFALIGALQHGIAVGSMNRQTRVSNGNTAELLRVASVTKIPSRTVRV